MSVFYCFSGDEMRNNMLAEPLWIQAILSLSDPKTAEEDRPKSNLVICHYVDAGIFTETSQSLKLVANI